MLRLCGSASRRWRGWLFELRDRSHLKSLLRSPASPSKRSSEGGVCQPSPARSSSLRHCARLARERVKADKLASTTPTRPLELPPFVLAPLLHPLPPSSSSRPTSPSKAPSSPTQTPASRLGQLVSSVAQVGAAAGAAAAGAVHGAAAGEPKPLALKSVEAGAQRVWAGLSDGRIRLYEVSEEVDAPAGAGAASPRVASPTTPGRRPSIAPKQVRVPQHAVHELVLTTPFRADTA